MPERSVVADAVRWRFAAFALSRKAWFIRVRCSDVADPKPSKSVGSRACPGPRCTTPTWIAKPAFITMRSCFSSSAFLTCVRGTRDRERQSWRTVRAGTGGAQLVGTQTRVWVPTR